jgi:hypothetical protein
MLSHAEQLSLSAVGPERRLPAPRSCNEAFILLLEEIRVASALAAGGLNNKLTEQRSSSSDPTCPRRIPRLVEVTANDLVECLRLLHGGTSPKLYANDSRCAIFTPALVIVYCPRGAFAPLMGTLAWAAYTFMTERRRDIDASPSLIR